MGVQVARDIHRKQELVRWTYWPKGVSGFNSRFGHLIGIEDIRPAKSFELIPFSVGRASFVPESDAHPDGRDLFGTAGLDLRYGLTPGISLNGTINPDFGQVEADPSVLNLSVFETFFDERRPFFLEGNSIYQYSGPGIVGINGPARLFHSRRIGRRPGRFSIPDDSEIIDQPEGTTILGALNFSGKNARGTSFSFIDAVTDDEFSLLERAIADPDAADETTDRFKHKVEPTTNWVVGRVKQDVLSNSHVGAFASSVNGRGFDPSYVGSIDGELNLVSRTLLVAPRWTGSVTRKEEDIEKRGQEASLLLARNGESFGGELYIDTRTKDFDTNDLGFMDRADRTQIGTWAWAVIRNPYWLARDSRWNINFWQHWNHDGIVLRKGFNWNNWHTLHNYWNVGFGGSRERQTFDDLVTRGGPVMLVPPKWDYFLNLATDGRKALFVRFFPHWRGQDGGKTLRQYYGARIRYRPLTRFTVELNPAYRRTRQFAQWIENVDDDRDGTDDRFVFGKLLRQDWDLHTRVTISFTPDINLKFWMQQFVTTGDYGSIKELARPKSFDFVPYDGLEENPDFSQRSLRSNLVLRWEYRPGSTLFAIWQQSRNESFDDDNPPEFEPVDGMFGVFGAEGDNIFMVKLTYWMGG